MIRRLIVVSILIPNLASAQYFQLELMKKRQSQKDSTRWTLFDWMSQKQKMSLWDQWLDRNRSANVFELSLEGSQFNYDLTTQGSTVSEVSESSRIYGVEFWVWLLGLKAEFEKVEENRESRSALLGLRLIGSSLQSTNLIVRMGLQKLENSTAAETWENVVASATLRIYFLSFIGLFGEYRHFFESESNLNQKLSGYRVRSGAFIEWGLLRLFGAYWQEPLELTPSGGAKVTQDRDGVQAGIQLIF